MNNLYKCDCNDAIIKVKNVTIKIVSGLVVHDVICDECGNYMKPIKNKRNYTKEGVASLGRMDKQGSSY